MKYILQGLQQGLKYIPSLVVAVREYNAFRMQQGSMAGAFVTTLFVAYDTALEVVHRLWAAK